MGAQQPSRAVSVACSVVLCLGWAGALRRLVPPMLYREIIERFDSRLLALVGRGLQSCSSRGGVCLEMRVRADTDRAMQGSIRGRLCYVSALGPTAWRCKLRAASTNRTRVWVASRACCEGRGIDGIRILRSGLFHLCLSIVVGHLPLGGFIAVRCRLRCPRCWHG